MSPLVTSTKYTWLNSMSILLLDRVAYSVVEHLVKDVVVVSHDDGSGAVIEAGARALELDFGGNCAREGELAGEFATLGG